MSNEKPNERRENIEEKLLEGYRQLVSDVMDPISKARYDNLRAIREHIHHYVLLSLAILGFTVPVLSGRSSLISNFYFLTASMFFLVVIVVYGMWYLTRKLQKDNNDLTTRFWKYSDLLISRRTALDNMLQKKDQETVAAFSKTGDMLLEESGYNKRYDDNTKSKRHGPVDYSLDVIFVLFLLSIVFYIFAVIPLDANRDYLHGNSHYGGEHSHRFR